MFHYRDYFGWRGGLFGSFGLGLIMAFDAVGKETWDEDASEDFTAFDRFQFTGCALDYTAVSIIGGD